MARTIKLYKLPDETSTPGLRPMRPEDVPQVRRVWGVQWGVGSACYNFIPDGGQKLNALSSALDFHQVTVLLNNYLSKFRITQVFDEEEVAHW